MQVLPLDQAITEDEQVTFWQPRVMKHRMPLGGEQFAVHEVYFDGRDGHIKFYSKDAMSPRETSVDRLKSKLLELLDHDEDEFAPGDLGFMHHKDDIRFWLEFIDFPPFVYDD